MRTALALTLLLGSSALLAQTEAARPAKQGDVHVYAVEMKAERAKFDETVTVLSIEGGNIRTRNVRSDREGAATEGLFTPEWGAIRSPASGARFETPYGLAIRPLQVGSARSFDSQFTVGDARLRLKGEVQVQAQEKISTPAGEFDVYRIEQKGYINGMSFQGGWGFTTKAWYAPAIDRVVRIEYKEQRANGADNTYVLKSFQPAD